MASIYQLDVNGKFSYFDELPCKVRHLEPAAWDVIFNRKIYK